MACKYKYKDKWYSESEVKNQILRDISLNDVIVELSTQMSYTVEINTAKKTWKNEALFDGVDLADLQFIPEETKNKIDSTQNAQYYSNLTVPGGTNGSYREQNFETPLIKVPKSHAQFNTENTIGFSRNDDRQIYTEKDVNSLLEIMQKSGILEIKC